MKLLDLPGAPDLRRVRFGGLPVLELDDGGARFSIADITALVSVDLGTPSVFEIAPDQKHLARWHAAVSSRPSAAA